MNKYTAMCWSARKLMQKQLIGLNYELCLKYIDSSLSKVEAKRSSLKSWKRKNTNMCTFQSVLSFRLTFHREVFFYNIQIAFLYLQSLVAFWHLLIVTYSCITIFVHICRCIPVAAQLLSQRGGAYFHYM